MVIVRILDLTNTYPINTAEPTIAWPGSSVVEGVWIRHTKRLIDKGAFDLLMRLKLN